MALLMILSRSQYRLANGNTKYYDITEVGNVVTQGSWDEVRDRLYFAYY